MNERYMTSDKVDQVLAETFTELLDKLYDMLVEIRGNTEQQDRILSLIRWVEMNTPAVFDEPIASVEVESGLTESPYFATLIRQAQQQIQQ